MTLKLKQVGDFVWEIPREGGMKVPGRVYMAPAQVDQVRKDKALDQVANVAHLPGIVGYSLAMPDIHWGYGFPIGGVAAVDAEHGAVSPGGIGFDVNCLGGTSRVLHAYGYTRTIAELVEQKRPERVQLIDLAAGSLATADVYARSASKPRRRVVELTTSSGASITATVDHPFLTPDGMREAGTLVEGDRVAVLPFEGVPYTAPSSETIVDEARIRAVAAKLGKSNSGNGLNQALKRLSDLLPLTYDHPALPVLLKVAGYVLGDGTIYWERSRMKGRVVVYGAREDLETMASDLAPWFKVSPIHSRHRHHHIPTVYGVVDTEATEHSARIGSTGLALLLAAMGLPIGSKANQDWGLPECLDKASLWQRRLFVAGFFGAELTTPDPFAKRGKNFKCPVLVVVKRERSVASGIRFLRDLGALLADFGIKVLTVSERQEQLNTDGQRSIRLRLVFSSRTEELVALWGRVGFEYNRKRSRLAAHAVSYLLHKQHVLHERDQVRERVIALRREHKWGATRIVSALAAAGCVGVNTRFVERTIYGGAQRIVRSAFEYPTFRDWIGEAIEGLGESGAVWETIGSITSRRNVPRVYDITVDHRDHNFVANGFVVHNCGVRAVTTELEAREVRPRMRAIVSELFDAVPTGVGVGRGISSLGKKELKELMGAGARWAVERGYAAGGDDAAHCEEGGCLRGADPDSVSDRALGRGADQVGTLGSGNHFLEVQEVAEIYDEEAARAFGLRTGQVVMMIHCGSRGLGHQVCDETLRDLTRTFHKYGPDYAALPDRQLACAPIRSDVGQRYLGAMQAAANFAWANRQVITGLAIEALAKGLGGRSRDLGARLLYDVCHNIAKLEEHMVGGASRKLLVHRKGATRAFGAGDWRVPEAYRAVGQPVIIPGDMGRYSFILAGNEEAMHATFGSSCHGAGRLLSRTAARTRARGRRIDKELRSQGIEVMSKGRRTLDEEMSEAYKDVADVVDVIDGAGISRKVARLIPLGVIKG